jgi:uncharacterized membrane protein YkvA (DUF1232 family)
MNANDVPQWTEAPSEIDPVLARFWEVVRRAPAYLRLAIALGRDQRVPPAAKGMLAAGGIYTVSPIDLIPGIIPVAGQLDDVVVLLISIRQAIQLSPPDVAGEYLRRYDVSIESIDGDLAATRDLALWLVMQGARLIGRTISRGGQALWDAIAARRT